MKSTDDKYPLLLKSIPDEPKKLYYRGNYSPGLFDNCLAVVGSRRMSSYGGRVIEKLFSEIADTNITIVSGFMYGVDAKAHEAALDFGLKTIAVMAGGVDVINPRYQSVLYKRILSNGGLIVAECRDGTTPKKWLYPKRNRIIAGMSKAALIVECTAKSGTMITVKYMQKYERIVLAVPGNIDSKLSEGPLQLLKENAKTVISGYDIRKYFIDEVQVVSQSINLSQKKGTHFHNNNIHALGIIDGGSMSLESNIVRLLIHEPLTVDELIAKTKSYGPVVIASLTKLELAGKVCSEAGKYYAN